MKGRWGWGWARVRLGGDGVREESEGWVGMGLRGG